MRSHNTPLTVTTDFGVKPSSYLPTLTAACEDTRDEPVPTNPAPIIDIRNVSKQYGNVCALAGVTLPVHEGEFLTLLGPSGSGKTTLLNVVAGFVDATEGIVALDGRDISHQPAHRRGFGMVFQSYALFPHLTVAENVAYPLRMRRVSRSARKQQVRSYLKLVELEDHAERLPHELSGGQQQRVALARALVFHPRVLLMDEPLGALDRRLRQTLQFEIKRLHRELGITIVYVTHDQEEALSMSDRIAVMAHGRIQQVGDPRSVYEHPRTEFVATFLGETNLILVEVSERSGEAVPVTHQRSGQTHVMKLDIRSGLARLSVRPEHIQLAGVNDDSRGFVGAVETKTFMGDRWRYECVIGEDTIVVHSPISTATHFDVGTTVRIIPVDAYAVAFPQEDQQRDILKARAIEGGDAGLTESNNEEGFR
jgi:spermidine/putrescine ABC transporter ATP-binding subunit